MKLRAKKLDFRNSCLTESHGTYFWTKSKKISKFQNQFEIKETELKTYKLYLRITNRRIGRKNAAFHIQLKKV